MTRSSASARAAGSSPVIGTTPALLAWIGLWWAQYPAEMMFREQAMPINLDNGMPIYANPRFRSYFSVNFRIQILFTLVPVMLMRSSSPIRS